jgi:hypothetical protein
MIGSLYRDLLCPAAHDIRHRQPGAGQPDLIVECHVEMILHLYHPIFHWMGKNTG